MGARYGMMGAEKSGGGNGMSGKKLFLVGLLCVALVALILLALTSAYIAVSYRWLLVPLGVWAAAMLVFHFRKKDG